MTEPISATIRRRLTAANIPFHANDTLAEHLLPGELDQLQAELTERMAGVLNTLLIDTVNDHNTKGTASRVAKMYLREVFAGRYEPLPRTTDFPNVKKMDELYTVGPIAVRSACSHHLCPIEGELWCGVIPSDKVIGLSKFARIARHYFARPQIQEEATVQLADHLEQLIKPRGLAVVIRAKHTCMTWRGVQEHVTGMTTSVTRGIIRDDPAARAELFALFSSQGFSC